MTDNVMLDPSDIFITKEVWDQNTNQDYFLENLINTFKEVKSNGNLKILWSSELECILWEDSKYSPWNEISSSKNKLIPILYRFFSTSSKFIEIDSNLCSKIPNFINDKEIMIIYSKLSEKLLVNQIKFYLYSHKQTDINFISSNKTAYDAPLLRSSICILKLNLNDRIFNSSDFTFIDFIEKYADFIGIRIINKFQFTSAFINKIKRLNNNDILELCERLILRLSYNASQARGCAKIQEEFITANKINEFRIRISPRPTSKRVHFVIENNTIVFKMYYGVGEHDDGL